MPAEVCFLTNILELVNKIKKDIEDIEDIELRKSIILAVME